MLDFLKRIWRAISGNIRHTIAAFGIINGKKRRTYRSFLINLVSDDTRALEHILARTGSEAHFFFSGTCVLVGAVLPREFALGTTCVWRNVTKVGRGKSCYKLALSKDIMSIANIQNYFSIAINIII